MLALLLFHDEPLDAQMAALPVDKWAKKLSTPNYKKNTWFDELHGQLLSNAVRPK